MRYKTNEAQRGQADTETFRLAQGLGIFGLLLGTAELLCAKRLGRALGLDGKEWLLRLYGGREILSGIPILTSEDPTPWVWGRVAGDALDLGTLACGYLRDPSKATNIITALLAVAGAAAADVYCAAKLSRESRIPLPPPKDYSDRSGFPRAPAAQATRA